MDPMTDPERQDAVVMIGTVGTSSGIHSEPEAPAPDRDEEALAFFRDIEHRHLMRDLNRHTSRFKR